jgi:hypothetical protein
MANTKALPNGWRYRQVRDLVDISQRAMRFRCRIPSSAGVTLTCPVHALLGGSLSQPLSRVGASLDNFSIFMAAHNQGEVCFQVIPCNRSNPRFLRSPSELAQESSILVFG